MPQGGRWPGARFQESPALPTWTSLGQREVASGGQRDAKGGGACCPQGLPNANILSRWAPDFMDRREKQNTKKAPFPSVCVCVYLYFDNHFTWPPFHDLESVSIVGISETPKQ